MFISLIHGHSVLVSVAKANVEKSIEMIINSFMRSPSIVVTYSITSLGPIVGVVSAWDLVVLREKSVGNTDSVETIDRGSG